MTGRRSRARRSGAATCSSPIWLARASSWSGSSPRPRRSLVARIEGRRADAPSLLLMGHTDVVPVSPDRWRQDPFGGELIDGWVWGRGAVDMLNLTASMAVGVRRLAESGFRPDGTLTYLAVADEEALGAHGAGWLTDHAVDAVGADYVITEAGWLPRSGWRRAEAPGDGGGEGRLLVPADRARVAGHASQPYKTDNARHGRRGRPSPVRVSARDPDPRRVAWLPRRDGAAGGDDRAAARPGTVRRSGRGAAARHGADVPRLHPRHHRPDGGPRRHQAQRDPRLGDARGRHPHPPRPDGRRRSGDAGRRARRPGVGCGCRRCQRRSVLGVADGDAAVGSACPDHPAGTRGRRWCRS